MTWLLGGLVVVLLVIAGLLGMVGWRLWHPEAVKPVVVQVQPVPPRVPVAVPLVTVRLMDESLREELGTLVMPAAERRPTVAHRGEDGTVLHFVAHRLEAGTWLYRRIL